MGRVQRNLSDRRRAIAYASFAEGMHAAATTGQSARS